jgi:hypothetical protein
MEPGHDHAIPRPRPFTPAEIERVMSLWQLRYSYDRIGRAMGRNHSSIGDLVRRQLRRNDEADRAEEAREDAPCP